MTLLRGVLIAILALLLLVVGVAGVYLTQPMPFVRRGPEVSASDPDRLRAHVIKLSRELVPRGFGNLENLDRVAAYLRGEFEKTSARVSEQQVTFEHKSYRNVIASVGPEAGERIVVGAHYDAFGPFPGADDNASGVAGLLELARLLGVAKIKTRVDIVAFTLEEPPAFGSPGMGSLVHAASLRHAGVKLRAMICLEMIGYFSDEPGSQTFPMPILRLFYPREGNFIAVAGRLGEAKLARSVNSPWKKSSSFGMKCT